MNILVTAFTVTKKVLLYLYNKYTSNVYRSNILRKYKFYNLDNLFLFLSFFLFLAFKLHKTGIHSNSSYSFYKLYG